LFSSEQESHVDPSTSAIHHSHLRPEAAAPSADHVAARAEVVDLLASAIVRLLLERRVPASRGSERRAEEPIP
jgi:hypothetical protein